MHEADDWRWAEGAAACFRRGSSEGVGGRLVMDQGARVEEGRMNRRFMMDWGADVRKYRERWGWCSADARWLRVKILDEKNDPLTFLLGVEIEIEEFLQKPRRVFTETHLSGEI